VRRYIFLAVSIVCISGVPAPARAQAREHSKWDLAFLFGWTAPSLERRFTYAPEIGFTPPSFVVIDQSGEFSLTASGSAAFAGGFTYYFTDSLGIEGRIDSADVRIETSGPTFNATVDGPGPLPPFGTTVELRPGTVEVDRLNPLSANLKYRTLGKTRFVLSGGFSYLPNLAFGAVQQVGLGITDFDGIDRVRVRTVDIEARPLGGDSGRIGFNVGAGVEYPLTDQVAVVVDGRGFYFESKTFEWRAVSDGAGDEILQDLEQQLSQFGIGPRYFSVTGGIVLRF
jgi:opacity protein-like surface antigen